MSVTLENVCFEYRDKTVLKNISTSFPVNKISAVLGKSGSGKTTLLQLVNGIVKPSSGVIAIADNFIDYTRLPDLRKNIGYVIQQAGLFPHLTVFNNICIVGKVNRLPNSTIQSRVKELLDLASLDKSLLEKYPHELSGGEQQRVGLCRALFLNPPILLMDEPFASLDFETKSEIYLHFLHIQKETPRTVIMVTHDWNEAAILADWFVWIEGGRVLESGDKVLLSRLKNENQSRQ